MSGFEPRTSDVWKIQLCQLNHNPDVVNVLNYTKSFFIKCLCNGPTVAVRWMDKFLIMLWVKSSSSLPNKFLQSLRYDKLDAGAEKSEK